MADRSCAHSISGLARGCAGFWPRQRLCCRRPYFTPHRRPSSRTLPGRSLAGQIRLLRRTSRSVRPRVILSSAQPRRRTRHCHQSSAWHPTNRRAPSFARRRCRRRYRQRANFSRRAGQSDNGRRHPNAGYRRDGTLGIDGRLALSDAAEVLGDLGHGKGPTKSLVALGYAGWAPLQLEDGISRGAWVAMPEIETGFR